MKKTLGLLLEKIQKRQRNSVQFVSEIKTLVFTYILLTIGAEILYLISSDSFDVKRSSFVVWTVIFFIMYGLFENLLRIFISSKVVIVVSLIPALPLAILFFKNQEWKHLLIALIVAGVLRLLLGTISFKEKIIEYGIFILDVATLYLWWIYRCFEGMGVENKLLFAALIIMTLTALQRIFIEKNNGEFPFQYFLLMGILLTLLPMKATPIDWTPVKNVLGKISDVSENVVYYITSAYDTGGYSTGYSSLNVSGGKVKESKKVQLLLSTSELPYYVYIDDATGKQMQSLRVIYLQGGQDIDKRQLIDYLTFLYNHNVDRSQAAVFSQISQLNVEYMYLNTADEILPAGTIIFSGEDEEEHQKGYSEEATYLNIDYGSPYFENLCREETDNWQNLSYEEATQYMKQIYRMELKRVLSKEEYDELSGDLDFSQYLDLEGATSQMRDLSKEIIGDASNDYDKCKLIEKYLRQYPYSTDAVGGYNEESTMATPEGMADIADRFLFDTKEGYCVHYTSAMVMLLRETGIPARARTGYRYAYPFEKSEEYEVPASCAHVWPEAYIENVGWIPFEPTSGYYTSADLTWHRSGQIAFENGYSNLEELDAVPVVDTENIVDDKKPVDRLFVVAIIGIVLLSIGLLIAIAIGLTALVRIIHYKYATPEEKLRIDIENIKSILEKYADKKIDDRGLLTDYLAVAPESLSDEISQTFALYYRVLYGTPDEGIITPADTQKAKRLYTDIKSLAK